MRHKAWKLLLPRWTTSLVPTCLLLLLIVQPPRVRISAQEARSNPSPDRMVGAAEVYYLKNKNKTRSLVRIYLEGTDDDRKMLKDSISMDVIFEVDGLKVTKPQTVNLVFTVYANTKSKFTKDHNLQLYTDALGGMGVAEWRTRRVSTRPLPSGGTVEVFLSPPLEFKRIEILAKAREAIVTLGESTFRLKKSDFQAIKDLNETIEP